MQDSFLSSFTPSLMSPQNLEAIFVQREELIKDLMASVRESATTENKHYRLLIGMRGIGKTHTIALLYHRLKNEADLQDKLLIAWLKEEEWGVSSWLDLQIRIFQALGNSYPQEYRDKLATNVEALYKLSPEEATARGEIILKEFLGDAYGYTGANRTLLILTENFDEILKGLGDKEQKKFKTYLQEKSFITIVATAQNLSNDLKSKKRAFYGFFNINNLNKLSLDEVTNLLTKIASLQKDSELTKFIKSQTGRNRIKAIHHLAGGNHRVYIIFSQFLTRDSLDDLVKPVMQTLDELTPYYQARMQWLSPQQRKIVELLCDRRHAVPVKEIAQRCFISHQTASSQLKDLLNKGYVVKETQGRESFYELLEPLMRICLETKKQRGEPIKLFIDFLCIWYTEEELKNKLRQLPDNCLEKRYILRALELKPLYSNLFPNQKIDNDDESLIEVHITSPQEKYENILNSYNEAIERNPNDEIAWFNRGYTLDELGRFHEALQSINKAIEINSNDYQSFHLRGSILINLGRYEEAIQSTNKCIDINPNYDLAWFNLGAIFFIKEEYEKAVRSYDKGLKINPTKYFAWLNRGDVLNKLGRYEEAIQSFDKSLEVNPYEDTTWLNRGYALDELDRYEEAIQSFNQSLKINPNNETAWANRGIKLNNIGRYEEAVQSFDKSLEINPNNETSWANRGVLLSNLRRYKEAIKSYDHSIAIDCENYRVWNNRGNALNDLEKYEEALQSFAHAGQINPNYDIAWLNRGNAFNFLGRYEEAIQSYERAIKINPSNNLALANCGDALYKLNRYEEAIQSYERAIEINNEHTDIIFISFAEILFKLNRWQEGFVILDKGLDLLQYSKESYENEIQVFIHIIFESQQNYDIWKLRIQTLVKLCFKYKVISFFAKGITENISNLLSEMVSNKAARIWLEVWHEVAGDKPELEIALRFLKTAVEYKETGGDSKVLLQLPREERDLFVTLLEKVEE